MFGHNAKVILSFIVLPVILCCGCNETNQKNFSNSSEYTYLENDCSDCLYMNYSDFQEISNVQHNSACEYYLFSKVQNTRNVELCYSNLYNFFDTIVLEINANGIAISDTEVSIDAYNHYPVETVTKMTGTKSVDELWERMGQPYKYIEQEGISAILFKNSVVFGSENGFQTVALDNEIKAARVKSMQITKEAIYLFEKVTQKSKSSIAVTKILISEVPTTERIIIPFASMLLPEISGQILGDNTFISDNVVFFSINGYGDDSWIAAYDLTTGIGTSLEIQNNTYDGKLFRYKEHIGLMVSSCNESGYNTNMGIKLFDYDSKQTKLSENTDLYIEFAPNAKYIFGTLGNEFYCIDDTLCGIMHHINDGSFAYAEINLSSGNISAFIPFKTKSDSHILKGYIIRNDNVCVSPNNCGL